MWHFVCDLALPQIDFPASDEAWNVSLSVVQNQVRNGERVQQDSRGGAGQDGGCPAEKLYNRREDNERVHPGHGDQLHGEAGRGAGLIHSDLEEFLLGFFPFWFAHFSLGQFPVSFSCKQLRKAQKFLAIKWAFVAAEVSS